MEQTINDNQRNLSDEDEENISNESESDSENNEDPKEDEEGYEEESSQDKGKRWTNDQLHQIREKMDRKDWQK